MGASPTDASVSVMTQPFCVSKGGHRRDVPASTDASSGGDDVWGLPDFAASVEKLDTSPSVPSGTTHPVQINPNIAKYATLEERMPVGCASGMKHSEADAVDLRATLLIESSSNSAHHLAA